jgi:tetratricopeptide (TPR) repeat protein
VADYPTRPEFRWELATSHNNRAILLKSSKRVPEAEREYGETIRIFRQLATDYPSKPEYRRGVAGTLSNRGNLLNTDRRYSEAEQDYNEAVQIRRQLAGEYTARPEFRRDLAQTLKNRGALLQRMGRRGDAKLDGDASLGIYRQLVADAPDQPELRNELAADLLNLAQLCRDQGDLAAAKQLLLEGRPHHLAALKANPQHPFFREAYGKHLIVLTGIHAALLEQADALRTAETCRTQGRDPAGDAYDAACCLSLCVPIMAKHDKLTDTQRKESALFYADAAMTLLREAVTAGFRDAANMKADNDLDPLRERADFRKLESEVAARDKRR